MLGTQKVNRTNRRRTRREEGTRQWAIQWQMSRAVCSVPRMNKEHTKMCGAGHKHAIGEGLAWHNKGEGHTNKVGG